MQSRKISVRELVKYLANVDGGVHRSRPDKAWQKAIAEYGETTAYQTATGQYTGPVFCVIDVAAVARAGLEPLRGRIAARTSAVERATGRTRQKETGHAASDS